MPGYVLLIEERVGGEDDAFSEGLFREVAPDDVGTGVRGRAVGPEVLVGTAIRLAWLSLARKVLRRARASKSWARASGTSVVSATTLRRSVSAKS